MRGNRKLEVPRKNARGKKNANPGFISGDHWVACDICACAIRASDSMNTWDNRVVCPDDWEPRHEQDFVRSREDKQTPQGNVRPEPTDDNTTNVVAYPAATSTVPPATFDGSL
jgi:hypothetical protein